MSILPSLCSILCAVGLLSLCVFSGCGGPALQTAKGQIQVGGKNYQVGPREQLLVIFYPDGPNPNSTFPAEVNSDGSFQTLGMDGKGIPPGKYRVSISSPYGGGSIQIPKEIGTPQSPIVREVVQGKDTLEPIDIMKPAG